MKTDQDEPIFMIQTNKTRFGLDVTTKSLKVLIPNQTNQRLLPAIKQVQAGNTSEDLLDQTWGFLLCIKYRKFQKSM